MKRKYLAVVLASVLAAGCANINASKEVQGTAGGAVAGALIGAQTGGTRGAIVGALIGGFAGNRIGAWLDEEDKKKLAEIEARALQSNQQASFVTKSKAKVTVVPQEAKEEVVTDRVFLVGPGVEKQKLELAAHDAVTAYVDTPIYRSPSEGFAPLQTISKGVVIRTVATVINKEDWGAVGDGDTIIGYVPIRYLKSAIVNERKLVVANPPPAKKTANLSVSKPVIQAKNMVSTSPVIQTNKAVSATKQAAVPAATDTSVQTVRLCKVNLIKVDPPDGSAAITESRKYCKEPPKGWKVFAVVERRNNA